MCKSTFIEDFLEQMLRYISNSCFELPEVVSLLDECLKMSHKPDFRPLHIDADLNSNEIPTSVEKIIKLENSLKIIFICPDYCDIVNYKDLCVDVCDLCDTLAHFTGNFCYDIFKKMFDIMVLLWKKGIQYDVEYVYRLYLSKMLQQLTIYIGTLTKFGTCMDLKRRILLRH